MKWFLIKGTPTVTIQWLHQFGNVYELVLNQLTTNGNDDEQDTEMLIPTRIAFFDGNGEEIVNYNVLESSNIYHVRDDLFVLNKEEGRIKIQFQSEIVIPSINRGFTAPIKLEYQTPYEAAFIAKYETDQMARFDAFQHLYKSAIIETYRGRNIDNLIKELTQLIRFRFQQIKNSAEQDIYNLWVISRDLKTQEEQAQLLELALSIEEMYLSNLVDDFDTLRDGHVDPVRLSQARERMQNLLSGSIFPAGKYNSDFLIDELDPFRFAGSVKLEQVMLRTFINSREFADRLNTLTVNPSMERQIALLECRYRLSNGPEDRINLLTEFRDYIQRTSYSHPVAKEKLFKFIILKSVTGEEMKILIEHFDLLVPTQPQNLKLFAKEFASNNLAVFHSVEGLGFMAEVIGKCDKYGNHETAATLIKHSFEVNLLKLDNQSKRRVAAQLEAMTQDAELSPKLKSAVNDLLKKLMKTLPAYRSLYP